MAAVEHMLGGAPVPAGFDLTVDGRIALPDALIEVHSYHWTTPQDVTFTVRRPYIDLALSSRSPGARAEILGARPGRSERIGQMMFIPPEQRLQSRWGTGHQRSVCCALDPSVFLVDGDADFRRLGLDASLDVHNLFLEEALMLLAREAVNPGFGSDVLAQSICRAIALELHRHFRQRPERDRHEAGSGLDRTTLRTVEDYVHDHCAAPIDLGLLARQCNLSTHHLARMFRESTGMTLAGYVARLRIRKARTALADGTDPIKRIAFECGFRSVSAFSAAFRRETGYTPKAYRRLAPN